ncbi:hypothetical protein F5Y19DRAFT_468052 [Xylariaceae sp. FL1651]|nr:hypothetical protein F5Y19DRAFT_468052 [Xylariaceae sp. FL1651]
MANPYNYANPTATGQGPGRGEGGGRGRGRGGERAPVPPGPSPPGVIAALANPTPVAVQRVNKTVVCVICGGICKTTIRSAVGRSAPSDWMRPSLVQAEPKYLEWRKQSSTARAFNREDDEFIKEIQVTSFIGGSDGMTKGPKTLVIDTSNDLMKIPVHSICFDLAKRFCKDQARYDIDFRCADGGAPSSIAHLYEIWCKRAIATCSQGVMTKPIMEPHGYFGAPHPDDLEEYSRMMHRDPRLARFEACPVRISRLTDIVVNYNLQSMDGKDKLVRHDLVELWSRVQDLPQEVFDRIIDALEPFEENMGPHTLVPSRICTPTWWKDKLFSRQLIPWLWDLKKEDVLSYRVRNACELHPLDAKEHQENGTYIFDENMWDWELLCRQLAQPNVTEKGGILYQKTDALWNRRRIWKLLDAARLGHVSFNMKQTI